MLTVKTKAKRRSGAGRDQAYVQITNDSNNDAANRKKRYTKCGLSCTNVQEEVTDNESVCVCELRIMGHSFKPNQSFILPPLDLCMCGQISKHIAYISRALNSFSTIHSSHKTTSFPCIHLLLASFSLAPHALLDLTFHYYPPTGHSCVL